MHLSCECKRKTNLTYTPMVPLGFGIHLGKIVALDLNKDGDDLFTAEYEDGEREVGIMLLHLLVND